MEKCKIPIKAIDRWELAEKLEKRGFQLEDGVKVPWSKKVGCRRKLKKVVITKKIWCECCGPEVRLC